MTVKLRKIQKRNPMRQKNVRWHLVQRKTGTVGIREIAQEIDSRSALSMGDVQSVLSNLVKLMPLFFKLGQTIRLEGFGSFRLSITSEGTEMAEELSTHHVKGVKVLFLPSMELKRSLRGISFEIE